MEDLGESGLLLHLKGSKSLQVGILRLLLRDPAGLESHHAQLHRLLHVLHVSLRHRLPAHAACPEAPPVNRRHLVVWCWRIRWSAPAPGR